MERTSVRTRLIGVFSVVGALNILGWGLLIIAAPRYPTLLGLGALAYSFGLRHAFDADHIAAIDNTTRKLLQQGRRPMGVGLFFSLGHSTVVFAMAVGLALAAVFISKNLTNFKTVGGVIGTSVSGIFLYIIAIINLIILVEIVRIFREMRTGRYDEQRLEDQLQNRGFMFRFFGPLFRLVTRSWHMYPIGVLFGLGFDTATEVSLLAISAGAASSGLPVYAIVALPILFAAGMSLMDSADGAFMAQAYRWAFSNPVRKVYYNLTITGLSVMVALFIGTIELLSVLASQFKWSGGLWGAVGSIDFNTMGFVIVGMFVVVWASALLIWRTQHIEERWSRLLRSEGR
jgi:nickel/cobalt transporter (NiCoT) family protein